MKNKKSERIILGIIMFAGAALRLWNYDGFSYSNDEMSALMNAHHGSFDIIRYILSFWTKLFGNHAGIVRLPFILFGIVCIPLLFAIGKRWFNASAGLFAAALFAILRFPVYYTQQARPYAFGLFFTLAAIYFWAKILFPTEEEKKMPVSTLRKYFAGFILFTVLSWYTHYYTIFITGIAFLSGLHFVKREQLKYYLLSGALMALLYLPHIAAALHHLSSFALGGKAGHLMKPDMDLLFKHLLIEFNGSQLTFLCAGAFLFLSIVLRSKELKLTDLHVTGILFFTLPLLAGCSYSALIGDEMLNALPVFSFPFLLLFLGSFLPLKAPKAVAIPITTALLAFCVFTTKMDNRYYAGGFKYIAEKTLKYDMQLGEHNYIKVLNIASPAYIIYYLGQLSHQSAYAMYSISEPADIARLQTMLDTTHSQYLLYGYESIANRHETEPLIRSQFPEVVEENVFYSSGLTLYKRMNDAAKQYLPQKEFISRGGEAFAATNISPITMTHDSISHYEEMNDKKEFGATFTSMIADMRMPDNSTCYLSAWIKTEGNLEGAELVLSFERNGKTFDWVGSDIKPFVTSPGAWHKVIVARRFPDNAKPADIMKAYVWNKDKKSFLVHDLDLKIFPPAGER